MGKLFKVELRDGTTVPIEVDEDETPESWLKKQPNRVVLHETSYLKSQDIVEVRDGLARKSE